MMRTKPADICILVEGSYPYVQGGVSSWVHDLIASQKDYTFSVVALLADDKEMQSRYVLPDNVVNVTHCILSELPAGHHKKLNQRQEKTLGEIEKQAIAFLTQGGLGDLERLLTLLKQLKGACNSNTLLNSPSAWNLLLHTYEKLMPENSFIDYFWSFRALLENLYSILLTPLPPAKLYHTTCTGYAGLLGARCRLETGKPLILTEHGIYTNERRIELLTSGWLYRPAYSRNYNINRTVLELRDLWIGAFTNYSRMCYEACSSIITLYQGNQLAQIADGAGEQKMVIIPNGIDCERYSSIVRTPAQDAVPTVAFIGRVVPIKDVKTFIRACHIAKGALPNLRVCIIGPYEEDKSYYEECCEMVAHLDLNDCIVFTGNVNIADYMPLIDIIVLTSISEAQPLVILEAGAAGIPAVATRVGACQEMIMGKDDECPALGAGGIVVPVSNPAETAKAMQALLTDKQLYHRCSEAIKKRVLLYYNKEKQHDTYHDLYSSLLKNG